MRYPARQLAACVAIALIAGALSAEARAAEDQPIDFAQDVQPIFKGRCLGCHNGVKRAGGLTVLQRADALAEADSGLRAIVPGKPEQSELLRRVASTDVAERMPADGPPLSPDEIETLRRWIAQGATWPTHWAFRAIERPPVPETPPARWARNPLDRFVAEALGRAGLEPSPEADPYTLIRRMHLDLIGLPPAPEDVDEFVRDASPEACEKLADRLLASPRFGERWGRHWLDLARYADTDGYEVDGVRPNAWFFRDWVIDAINEDVPFDRFTIEQLAGDLLREATANQHLATAFHRQTLTNKEGGADQEEYRVEAVIDRVNTTATVWLGLTTACTQCHDHPYEPLRQREFYGLFAFFNNADESLYRVLTSGEEEYQRRKAEHDRLLTELRQQFEAATGEERADLEREIKRHVRQAPRDPAVRLDVIAERTEPRTTHVFQRGNFLQPDRDAVVQPGVPAVLHDLGPRSATGTGGRAASGTKAAGDTGYADRLDLARWLVDPRNPVTARVAVNRIWQHLFGRGLVRTPDDFGLNGEPPTHPELLEWLAAEFAGRVESPETRVESATAEYPVRGTEYVPATTDHGPRTTNTFSNSQPPNHDPQFLAWSRKRLIRLVLGSATYRQASRHRPELVEIDPQNRLLHRQNRFRVEAEVVRDLYLAAGGLLAQKIGGPSVFPPFPAELAQIDFRSDLKWTTSTGADRYRRGMYTFFKRTLPHPDLTTFDCPLAESTTVERGRSNTPLQALLMLNNDTFIDAARGLAARVLDEAASSSDADRAALAFRLALTRPPTAGEQARLLELLAEHRAWYAAHIEDARQLAGASSGDEWDVVELAAWTATANILLNLDEFITRE